jgi:hypothetical protein
MNIDQLRKIRMEMNKTPYLNIDESFMIPQPTEGETQDEYVSRCMGVIGGEDKPQDQLVAMCIATYENK